MTLIAPSDSILSFPSRFGSNANVTENQAQSMAHSAGAPAVLLDSVGGTQDEDDLLPVGLDSHRYRCCGNGVVASVAEWIGQRIVAVDVLG
jgi:site-specific DNA-cytosine methylase